MLKCARDGCDTWQSDNFNGPNTWVIAAFMEDMTSLDFCTIDCMMHWSASNSTPTEIYNGE